MEQSLNNLLRQKIIVGDGAMGSMLHQLDGSDCLDNVNLTRPDLVLAIHMKYIAAGSDIIQTNTFSANRVKLARFNMQAKVAEINSRAVKIAREAREVSGKEVLIGGSIGPLGRWYDILQKDARREVFEAFQEQASALDERGVDLLILETFPTYREIEVAVEAVRSVSRLPIIAQLSFPDEWTPSPGPSPAQQLQRLCALPVQIVGMNCGMGPEESLRVLEKLTLTVNCPVSVQPNAGVPQKKMGRYVYPSSTPEYFSEFAEQAVRHGARLIGGCCGTTPKHIEAIASIVDALAEAPSARPIVEKKKPEEELIITQPQRQETDFQRKLKKREFVRVVQLDPPKGTETEMMLAAAREFKDSGIVDAVDINSNPMARLHLDSLWMSAEIETRVGIETIPHITPRDASLMGLEASLLGAWNHNISNVLIITGDPTQLGDMPGSMDVYQTDSVGLVKIVSQLNQGRDWTGQVVGSAPRFTIGVAVNPNAEDLDLELTRFRQKIDNGADFAMTQVFFEWQPYERFLDKLGGKSPIPILVAVWPLTSHRLAQRLHNEVPGIIVPEWLQKELQVAGSKARQVGLHQARQFYREAQKLADGVYVIAPFKKPQGALRVFKQ